MSRVLLPFPARVGHALNKTSSLKLLPHPLASSSTSSFSSTISSSSRTQRLIPQSHDNNNRTSATPLSRSFPVIPTTTTRARHFTSTSTRRSKEPPKMPVDTPITRNLAAKNEIYAQSYTPEKAALLTEPKKQYCIVTCMDSRIHVSPAFGIDLGDAHIIRNAGGSAKEALRSIVVSQQLLNTKEIVLVKHTACGLQKHSNEMIHQAVTNNLGTTASRSIDFLPFDDLEAAVKEDVQFLRDSELIDKSVPISGWVFEVETGKCKRIC